MNVKLITKGIIKSVITIITAFGFSQIIHLIDIQIPLVSLGGYSDWVLRWGVVVAGLTFIKDSATKDSWRFALGDFMISIATLLFMFKLLSLEITVSEAGLTVVVSIIGFFYLSLIATLISIVGKAIRIFEGIGK
ncbi:MAG: hypothetical protein DRO67_02555 [Candidatus Asgardarchaeum californiense]|nr:MAG: hypothetical protein DRO67_02555 [Candidatus Asgardarchaeum californiense]